MDKTDISNKKILVTGGSGYLGSKLCKKLSDLEAEVYNLDIKENKSNENIKWLNINLAENDKLKKCLESIKPDLVYHLAANINRTRDFQKANEILAINQTGTINLLNALKNVDYKNFIFTSTSEVYGGKEVIPPFKEEMNFTAASPYSLSKVCAEHCIKTFSEINKKNYTILRLFNFYGNDMPSNFFLPQLIEKLSKNGNFKMTKGEQKRDFLHVDDIIQALLLSTKKKAFNNTFNVCSGKSMSMKDIAIMLKKQLNSKSQIKLGAIPYRDNEIWNMTGNNNKIIEYLNFKQTKQFNEKI